METLKTVKQVFEETEDKALIERLKELKAEFLFDIPDEDLYNSPIRTLGDYIQKAFPWKKTQEGPDYWEQKAKEYGYDEIEALLWAYENRFSNIEDWMTVHGIKAGVLDEELAEMYGQEKVQEIKDRVSGIIEKVEPGSRATESVSAAVELKGILDKLRDGEQKTEEA